MVGMKNARPTPCALVVDDDALIRMNAAEILEEAGFATVEAGHADEALEFLREHHQAVVLLFTDVQMPGSRDGFALARETARHWPHITIVVASGLAWPGPDDLPDGAQFIAKPFSADVVHQHLRDGMPDQDKPDLLKAD